MFDNTEAVNLPGYYERNILFRNGLVPTYRHGIISTNPCYRQVTDVDMCLLASMLSQFGPSMKSTRLLPRGWIKILSSGHVWARVHLKHAWRHVYNMSFPGHCRQDSYIRCAACVCFLQNMIGCSSHVTAISQLCSLKNLMGKIRMHTSCRSRTM